MGAAMAIKTTGPPMAVPSAATRMAWARMPSCTRSPLTPSPLAISGPKRSTASERER